MWADCFKSKGTHSPAVLPRRLRAHEERNAERKLTPQQRKEKRVAKLKEDTSAGVRVTVFRCVWLLCSHCSGACHCVGVYLSMFSNRRLYRLRNPSTTLPLHFTFASLSSTELVLHAFATLYRQRWA